MTDKPIQSIVSASLLGALLVVLAGCTDPPDLDASIDPALEEADYPDLVPIDDILGPDTDDPVADAGTADRLEARAAGLESRARQLQRQRGIDDDTRRRLNSDIATD